MEWLYLERIDYSQDDMIVHILCIYYNRQSSWCSCGLCISGISCAQDLSHSILHYQECQMLNIVNSTCCCVRMFHLDKTRILNKTYTYCNFVSIYSRLYLIHNSRQDMDLHKYLENWSIHSCMLCMMICLCILSIDLSMNCTVCSIRNSFLGKMARILIRVKNFYRSILCTWMRLCRKSS